MASINNAPWYCEILADGIELGRRLCVGYGFKKGFENDYQGLLSVAMDTETLAGFRANLPNNEWHPQGDEW